MNIVEFAKTLNLSTATISRALNNRPEVSAETRQLVLEKAQQLGFSRNASARQLVSGRNHLIRMECPSNQNMMSDHYLLELVRALEETFRKKNYGLLLRVGSKPSDGPSTEQHSVDGMVIVGDPSITADAIDELTQFGRIPAVVIGASEGLESEVASFVHVDTIPGVLEALTFFAALGHRRVGYIGSGYLGYQIRSELPRLMERAGLSWDPTLTLEAGVTREAGHDAAMTLLSFPNPPSAIFARTDVLAWGAMEAAKQMGLSVPGDLSIIGHDNVKISSTLNPSLTTVAINIPEVGRLAASALFSMMESDMPPGRQTSGAHLVIRQSCGVARRPFVPSEKRAERSIAELALAGSGPTKRSRR